MAEPTTPPPSRREGLWLWALAALVLLAILIVFAVRACDDDEGTDNSGTPIPTDTSSGTVPTTAPSITGAPPETTPGGSEPPKPVPPSSRGEGTLVVGSEDLYQSLGGSLAEFTNEQVTGKGVRVISVVGDESFWAGRSKTQRLLVVINLKGKSPPKVRANQTVNFVGQLRPNEADHGVTEAAGKTLLERQGHHAFVSVGDLMLR